MGGLHGGRKPAQPGWDRRQNWHGSYLTRLEPGGPVRSGGADRRGVCRWIVLAEFQDRQVRAYGESRSDKWDRLMASARVRIGALAAVRFDTGGHLFAEWGPGEYALWLHNRKSR